MAMNIYFLNTEWRKCLTHSKGRKQNKDQYLKGKGGTEPEGRKRRQNDLGARGDKEEGCCVTGRVRNNTLCCFTGEVPGNQSTLRI